jgi:hypothetical protein
MDHIAAHETINEDAARLDGLPRRTKELPMTGPTPPFTVQDIHHQLRRHPELLTTLAQIYEVDPDTLRLIESQPAERIEVWERDAAKAVPAGTRSTSRPSSSSTRTR